MADTEYLGRDFVESDGLYVQERPPYLVEGFRHVSDFFRETRKRPGCHGLFMVFGDHDRVEELSDYLNGKSQGSGIIRDVVKRYGEEGLLYNSNAMRELLERICFFERGDIDGALVFDANGNPHLDNETQDYGMRQIYHSRRYKIPQEMTMLMRNMKGADVGTKVRVAICASKDKIPGIVAAESTRAVMTFVDGSPVDDLYLEPEESHLDEV